MAERHHICVFVDDIRRTPMAIGDATSSSAEDEQSQRFVRYLLSEAFRNERCEEQRRVMRPCSGWMLRPATDVETSGNFDNLRNQVNTTVL